MLSQETENGERRTGKGERRKGNLKRGKWNGSLGPKAQR